MMSSFKAPLPPRTPQVLSCFCWRIDNAYVIMYYTHIKYLDNIVECRRMPTRLGYEELCTLHWCGTGSPAS
jgi:hypothetical protein